jgi:hypothetical protein
VGGPSCWGTAGHTIDAAVERLFIEQTTPDALDPVLHCQGQLERGSNVDGDVDGEHDVVGRPAEWTFHDPELRRGVDGTSGGEPEVTEAQAIWLSAIADRRSRSGDGATDSPMAR